MGTTATRMVEFIRMNPSEFHGSNIEEYSLEFIDEVYKMLMIMGVKPVEKGGIGLLSKGVLLKFGSTNGRKRVW